MTASNVSTAHRVELETTGQTVMIPSGSLIVDALHAMGVNINADCGGKGICGQCRVVISAEKLPPPGAAEMKLLAPDEQAQGVRLACCSSIDGDIKIRLDRKSASTDIRLQVVCAEGELKIDPVIDQMRIALPPDDTREPTRLLDRIALALKETYGIIDLAESHIASATVVENRGPDGTLLNACLRNREVVAALPETTTPIGLALDLGTTKVAAYLMDLTTGETLASDGILNPQGRFGADIMTRLQHAVANTGAHHLMQEIRSGMDKLLCQLTEYANVYPHQIVDACLVANTAMVHLLIGLPVHQMARAPYTPATLKGFDLKARDIALNISPEAYVHIPPAIGGFVGADHVAMIMASGIDQMDQVAIGLDIGTNTEIVLKRPDNDAIFCLSCPSGPAFEGAHISNGMRAAAGAIEEVRLTDSFQSIYTTVSNAPAIGLCGSAMIDAVSELYRTGLINDRGRFKDEIKYKNHKFTIVPSSESGTGEDIWLSQKDIDEILLAKGAIRAGIEVLLRVSQTRPDQVNHVYIAGAFGSYINLAKAIHIGLIPDFSSAGYHQIGNAAALGAKQTLLSRTARQRAEQIVQKSRYIELTRQHGFNRHFARGIMLPKGATIHSGEDS